MVRHIAVDMELVDSDRALERVQRRPPRDLHGGPDADRRLPAPCASGAQRQAQLLRNQY